MISTDVFARTCLILFRTLGFVALYHAHSFRLARRIQRMVLEGYRGGRCFDRQQRKHELERTPAAASAYDSQTVHASSNQEERPERAWRQGE